jgi:hypothetical protein
VLAVLISAEEFASRVDLSPFYGHSMNTPSKNWVRDTNEYTGKTLHILSKSQCEIFRALYETLEITNYCKFVPIAYPERSKVDKEYLGGQND